MRQQSSLLIVGERDAGSYALTKFRIVEGREKDAAEALVTLLNEGHEVSLSNDLDEGGEGSSTFRSEARGYARLNGGHGWQDKWTPLDDAEVRAAILALAPLNQGEHWSQQGTISRLK